MSESSYPDRSLGWAHAQNGEAVKHLYESWSPDRLGDEYELMLDVIFNLNKDQLSDPDKIKPGQVLKIPAGAHK